MRTIIEYLDLDFSFSDSNAVAYIKQGDAGGGKELAIRLFDAGERVEVGTGTVATLFASTNGIVTANGDSCPINSDVVYVPITSALSGVAGREHCEIRLTTNDKIVHTARFDLIVGESAVSDDMPAYVSTASILDRIEALEEGGGGGGVPKYEIAEMIQSAFQARTPAQPVIGGTVAIYNAETLTGDNPYFEINTAPVVPYEDGVMLWINDEDIVSPARYRVSYNNTTRMLRISLNSNVLDGLSGSDYFHVIAYSENTSNECKKIRAAIESAYREWNMQYLIIPSLPSNSTLLAEEPYIILNSNMVPRRDTVVFVYRNDRNVIAPAYYTYDNGVKKATLSFDEYTFEQGDLVEIATYTEHVVSHEGITANVAVGSSSGYQGTSEEANNA